MTGTPVHPTPARPLEIAILVAPGYMPIDIIGFQTAFGMLPADVNIHLVWKDLGEIIGHPHFPTRATTTFADTPTDLDVVYCGAVPAVLFEDAEVLEFLADRGHRAGWVAGVCGGALLLGAAGLLVGYRATTNFHLHDQLPYYGAIPERGNVVEDRNRITAGPATGSNEIGLRLIQAFYGDEAGMAAELNMEYAPTPLFGTGSPELAGPGLTRASMSAASALRETLQGVGERAAHRLGLQPTSV